MRVFLSICIFSLNFLLLNGGRPPTGNRKFKSSEVDAFIEKMKPNFKNSELAQIYENCFPNTLDTTVEHDEPNEDTFIITGDIEAMWLRDSSFQIFPYIQFAKKDDKLKKMMLHLIKRQAKSIIIDPYANAFNKNDIHSPWEADQTYKLVNGKKVAGMNTKLWERKYELDSTVSTLFFAYNFYEQTGETSFILDLTWQEALQTIINLVKKEMRGTEEEDKNGGAEYFFQRSYSEPFDSLHQGRGNPVASCGMVKTMFRNSDDATTFSYNIPENAFLVSTFRKIVKMLNNYLLNNISENRLFSFSFSGKLGNNFRGVNESKRLRIKNFIDDLESIYKKVEASIYENGVFTDLKSGERYFAYEVDCFGNHYFIDDPGYPSLTALPFFGFIELNDPLYISTRKRILSNKNPYYFKNSQGEEGLGSAHTARYFIWPLFNIMRALTSTDEKEILDSINLLIKSAIKTGFMHESFNIEDVNNYSRSWFAWANSFFGYMINQVNEKYPRLLLK